jgi:hypothetical protein
MNRKQSFILCSGVFLLGLTFAMTFYAPHAIAASQLQPFLQTEADTDICPLSDKQQEDSIQKFSEMMPTFTHPRCINCHGAMNPFAANTNHVGGRIGPKFKEIMVHDDILGKDIKLVVPDLEDPDGFSKRCQDCHSAFTGSRGWTIPPVKVYFVGKDAVQLCKQMKSQFGGELQEFINHLDHDELGFIQEAFRGTRGLDDNGQATYLNETGKEFRHESPPTSPEAFVTQGKAWLEAMDYHGAGTRGGLTCGCEPHHYVLKGSADIVWFYTPGTPFLMGHADLEIPIEFNDDGSFTGETKQDVSFSGTTDVGGTKCSWTMVDTGQIWKAKGNIDQRGGMNVTFTIISPASDYTGVCTGYVNGTVTNQGAGGAWSMDPFSGFVSVGDAFPVIAENQGGYVKGQFVIAEEEKK